MPEAAAPPSWLLAMPARRLWQCSTASRWVAGGAQRISTTSGAVLWRWQLGQQQRIVGCLLRLLSSGLVSARTQQQPSLRLQTC